MTGNPNTGSYALSMMMVAQVVGLEPGDFVHTLGDAHLYSNHFEQTREPLKREPRPLPTMHPDPGVTDLFAFRSALDAEPRAGDARFPWADPEDDRE